jgi:hypothetical protein
MGDLYAGAAANVAVSAALFVLARRASGRLSAPARGVATAFLVILLAAYLVAGQDSLWLIRVLPTTSVLTLGNVLPPLAALVAGVISVSGGGTNQKQKARRLPLLPVALAGLGLLHMMRPLLGQPPPTTGDRWERGVCMQSSDSSCSAASAATLLAAHGVAALERNMARLCLTRTDGTSMLGVYRGLRRYTDRTPFSVRPLTGATVADLRAVTAASGPVLISVGLPRFPRPGTDPRYARDWGWTPGLRHAVVLFGFLPGGKIDMGDPSAGREAWDEASLDVLWNGEGLYLTCRHRPETK